MVPNLQSENTHQETRLRSRLLWCRSLVCMLTGAAGIAYILMQYSDVPEPWMVFSRPLMASLLLAFAVIENALRTVSPLPRSLPLDENASVKTRKFGPVVFTPRIELWLHHCLQLALTAISAALAIYLVSDNFSVVATLSAPDNGLILVCTLLLAACFALLVCERMLSLRRVRSWGLQSATVGLLRTLLSLFLLTAVALPVSRFSPQGAYWLMWLASLVVVLVAAEFLLRALAAACTLPHPEKQPPFLTQSLIAEQYRWPLSPLLQLRKKIVQHFGVDIGKIQAFRLMGQLFLPVVCGIVVVGWLVSGLNEVSADKRGVYEQFGRPVKVLSPGLHLGLPWPFGRVVFVDYGAVHELQLSEKSSVDEQPGVKIPNTIEGPAPQESWRLWDSSHLTDQAQIIASANGDKQSFQIVNMDIRLIWRVGMSDADAMNSLYQTDNLSTTLQRIARQVLTQYFAHQQLDALLNEQRATMSTALNTEIQKRLNALNIGVELLNTRIESIHPPAGAANAYHGVQAAQITANAQIARERGYSASQANDAQRKATTAIDAATATANELQAQANIALTRYSAEHNAWEINPEAYLNERRYQTYSKALANTPLLILDSQVAGKNQSILDLRQFSQPSR
ncbi:MAG TPA: protease modulator HflK [Scandinavium sp.]|uniref:protease modulator HflK n=1 Tax=Scandinavium sp. TaxID=2830653 RepID=UPI002E36A604|nr:protease modulator HflK [Scandinavium sp.]HEX4502533.1 protease modulator HflK [Scandinavium sp.]